MLTKEIIKDNRAYIDNMASKVMVTYLERSPLKGFEDSMSVARISYKQALAMLEVRDNSLLNLAKEHNLIKEDNSE